MSIMWLKLLSLHKGWQRCKAECSLMGLGIGTNDLE